MSLTGIISGVSGAMGLLSGVKGMFDSADAARKQRKLLAEGRAEESAWYKRNYYGDYLNNSMSRAAMKRVENTMRSNNRMNRAYTAVSGGTHESNIARNRQGLEAMENVMTNLAAQGDAHRNNIDAMHLQNRNSLRNNEMSMLQMDEQLAAQSAANGFNLLHNALLGAGWGRENA